LLILPLSLLLVVVGVYRGHMSNLLFFSLAIPFLFYSWRRPMPALFVSMLIGTNFFQLIPFSTWKVLHLGPGISLLLSDLLLLLFLFIAVDRLPKRQERPLFASFVLIWVAYIGIRFAINLLLGEIGLDVGVGIIRVQVGWLGYLTLIAVIETPKDLRTYVNLTLVIMVIATGYQIVEAIQGQRLDPLGLFGQANEYYTSTVYLSIEGRFVPYLWSRAPLQSIMALFLSLGCVMEGVRVRRYLPLALLAILGVLIAGVRAWYFGVAAGLVALLMFQNQHSRAAFRTGMVALALIAVVALLAPWMSTSYGNNPWDVWLARVGELLTFSDAPNYIGRVVQAERAWAEVRASPLFGYGWGSTYFAYGGETSMNTLLLHGFMGTGLILAMYLLVGWRAMRLWSQLPPSEERAYMAGILALLVLFLAMLFSQDSLNAGGFAVTAAVFVDRIQSFHRAGLIMGEA
jgi:hypothetical protein